MVLHFNFSCAFWHGATRPTTLVSVSVEKEGGAPGYHFVTSVTNISQVTDSLATPTTHTTRLIMPPMVPNLFLLIPLSILNPFLQKLIRKFLPWMRSEGAALPMT